MSVCTDREADRILEEMDSTLTFDCADEHCKDAWFEHAHTVTGVGVLDRAVKRHYARGDDRRGIALPGETTTPTESALEGAREWLSGDPASPFSEPVARVAFLEGLLGKYIAHVRDWGGAGGEFLARQYHTGQHGYIHFTPAEWAELERLAGE